MKTKSYTFKIFDTNPFWLTVKQTGDFTLRNARNDLVKQDFLIGTDTAEFELMLAAVFNFKHAGEQELELQLIKVVQHYHKDMPVTLWSANLDKFT